MDIIKWANEKGHTLIIAPSEIAILFEALREAQRYGHAEMEDFEIDVSPILDE